jgi:hypothetical protein
MRLFATMLLAGAALGIGVAHAGQQDFSLVNRTGYQIDEVYVSRSSSSQWGPDVMGNGTLSDSERADITFNAPDGVCSWDLKVKYNDGDTAVWNNVDLCRISRVTLFWDRNNGVTRAVAE